jgi:hypothetical protein
MEIFPVNAVMEGGEVIPVIKYRFVNNGVSHTVTPEEIKTNNLEGEVIEGEVITIPVNTK